MERKGLAIMKKQLRKILCSMICLVMLLSGVNVFAETPMQVKWRGDYSDNAKPKLIVEFTTPALYTQQITAVVYDKDIEEPVYSDYVRVTEVTVSGGETEEIEYNITNRFSETDGAYKVYLKGSGYLQEKCTDSADVYVINPTDIGTRLTEFKNAATNSDFATVLGKVDKALQLDEEADGDRKTKRIDIMFNIQANDFNGEFSNLENIRDAWAASDIIAYITDETVTDGNVETLAEGLKTRIESNSALLGIDTTGIDYQEYIDEVCEQILLYGSAYNNNQGVKCLKDLKGIINQYIGVNAVNAATEETLYDVFEDYKSYFEIPSVTLKKYNGYIKNDREKALRNVNDVKKNDPFEKNSELVAAFITGVNGVTPSSTTTEDSTTPSDDDSSPGTAITGPVSGPTAPTIPEATGFKDVPSSHWAYQYVTALSQKGIISGYDDNTFRPNNNVTREEFVKMIVTATGLYTSSAECSFADVPASAWYYRYVASGYINEIIDGIDETTFGVGYNITRQDVAVIAARVLTRLNAEIPAIGESTLTDMDAVSDYAQESVKLLNGMGIISGFDDGSFMPRNALTRAEAAAIISRLTANL